MLYYWYTNISSVEVLLATMPLNISTFVRKVIKIKCDFTVDDFLLALADFSWAENILSLTEESQDDIVRQYAHKTSSLYVIATLFREDYCESFPTTLLYFNISHIAM